MNGVFIMEVVKSIHEIQKNLEVLEASRKLANGDYEYYSKLIKRGTCFIAYYSGEKTLCFAPSRFIGYANNSFTKHQSNNSKDGKITTPKISQLLKEDCVSDECMEKSYKEFCQKLGFNANKSGSAGVKRKYWLTILSIDS